MTVPREERAKALALQITLEWIEHPEFRTKVSGKTFINSVSIGQTFLSIARETNSNEYDPVYRAAKERWNDALNAAEKHGWIQVNQTALGRPRRKEYGAHEVALALHRLRFHRSHELEQKDECISGGYQRTNISIVTVQENIWRDLLNDITAAELTGNSKADIAEAIGLPPRAAASFWRWLQQNGWKQKRARLKDGSRPYVIVQQGIE